MSKLKHTIETKIFVDYSDLEDFIAEQYNVSRDKWGASKYSFVADQECGNYSTVEFSGITKIEANDYFTDSYEEEDLSEWKNDPLNPLMTYTLLLDLVRQNKIPEGDYIIRVSW